MIAVFFVAALVLAGLSEGRPGPCNEPIDPGMCMAYFPMFAYNSETGRCEEFVYGGCGGNENRFETLEDCQYTCQKRPRPRM
ncbi:serine-type endopeptidase inhibitor activity [Sparganum proliferum]